MLELILAVGLAVGISAFCSVTEATLYSVPWSRIEQLRRQGRPSGNILFMLRSNVEKPISAILTLNTIANTAGAAVAGAAAASLFGQRFMPVFAVAFTVVILVFSEIMPKTMGVMYARSLAPALARPLRILVYALAPVIWLLGLTTRLLERKKKGPHHTEEDIHALVSLTRKSGVLKPYEELAINNILTLDLKAVRDICTPRTVVFSLPAEHTVAQAREEKGFWQHSRIPVYEDSDPEDVVGVVYRRHVMQALVDDEDDTVLSRIMKPVDFVVESLTLDKLLIKFLGTRTHIYVVLDEYGGMSGVVTLEDVLEEILGKEIVDETDEVADLRALARQRREELARTAKKDTEPS